MKKNKRISLMLGLTLSALITSGVYASENSDVTLASNEVSSNSNNIVIMPNLPMIPISSYSFNINDDGIITSMVNHFEADEIVVPKTVNGITVKGIAKDGIKSNYVTKISFEEGSEVETIADRAFAYNSNLVSVDLSNTKITTIGNGVFYSNLALQEIKLPETLKTIGSQAFYRCEKLKSIEIPNSVTKIEYDAFKSCFLNTIYVDNQKGSILGPNGWGSYTSEVIWKR